MTATISVNGLYWHPDFGGLKYTQACDEIQRQAGSSIYFEDLSGNLTRLNSEQLEDVIEYADIKDLINFVLHRAAIMCERLTTAHDRPTEFNPLTISLEIGAAVRKLDAETLLIEYRDYVTPGHIK